MEESATGDVFLYREYGLRLVAGDVPYRDFFVEYPPGALPVFAAVGLVDSSRSVLVFKALMVALAAAVLWLVVAMLHAIRASRPRAIAAIAPIAVAPITLGQILITRYDLWPAMLTTGALASLIYSRPRLGAALLGGAAAAKIYPIILAPLLLAFVAGRFGRRTALSAAAWLVGVLFVCFVPFLMLAPGGIRYSAEFQLSRPLHIESLGGGLLLASHHVGLFAARVESSFNSENLVGPVAGGVADATSVLQWAAVLAVWLLFARKVETREGLLAAAAAAVCAFVAFGKVLSPQFLVWLLPLVGFAAWGPWLTSALLVSALLLTRFFDHWDGVGLSSAGWLVVARNLILVALFGLLLRRNWRTAGS